MGNTLKTFDQENIISTGSINLDLALGIGGLPRGRITEIYGPESSGKTTLALHVIAQAQKAGGKCTFIDAEHAFDPVYSQKIGVNVDELLVNQPEHGEQALQIADSLIKSQAMDVIVIDSVAALIPKSELEGNIGDHHIGAQARLMSQALRFLTASLSNSPTVLIFINQIRHKVGVMFGSPEVTSGGHAMKFYCSIRLDVRRVATNKKGDEATGNQVRVTVAKNKLAPPFSKAHFDIEFGRGISRAGELVDLGVSTEVLEKSGSWYSYQGNQLGQGREKLKALLEEDNELANQLDLEIRSRLFAQKRNNVGQDSETEDTDDDSSPTIAKSDIPELAAEEQDEKSSPKDEEAEDLPKE